MGLVAIYPLHAVIGRAGSRIGLGPAGLRVPGLLVVGVGPGCNDGGVHGQELPHIGIQVQYLTGQFFESVIQDFLVRCQHGEGTGESGPMRDATVEPTDTPESGVVVEPVHQGLDGLNVERIAGQEGVD